MTCPACGFVLTPDARFCGGCGRPVETGGPAAADQAERRQLTVVFCDLVDSTQLSQSLDPEDLRELLTDYQRVCAEAVRRHDGHIAQYLGDGVLIYFGFPHAHEDDARRAVRCGLDVLQGMEALNRSHARRDRPRIYVRVGAHTGRVVVGPVGGAMRRESLALGDTPNIAARVTSLAAPGTLTVSDATWRIVQGFVNGASLGEQHLKGVSRPVGIWRIVGTTGKQSRLEVARELTPYVGRQREKEILEDVWTEARAGAARFVTLRGEAGIGKSRLVDVFRQGVEDKGTDLLELRCTPYSRDSAFLPLTELIERRLALDPTLPAGERLDRLEARCAALGLVAPDVGPLMAALLSIPAGDRYAPLEMSPLRRRTRTMEILVTALQALAARQPTILVAEDLHWVDASTLELLQLLVEAAPRLPLLGLFTARPEFEPTWSDGESARLLELTRLGEEEVEAIVRSVAGRKAMPVEVMREIFRRCDGVPLFVEEVARAVLESDVLEERESSWELLGPLPPDLIPASVDASLMARIDRLGEARGTAQLAATIGREFSWALIKAVSDREEAALGEDLERLVGSGLVWQTSSAGSERYVFKHALIRDAAYESLLRSTRQRYHERIADVLRGTFPVEVENQPEVVARHLTGAGKDEEALDSWEPAGQRALARSAVREAHGHLSRALECLARLPPTPANRARELELQIAIAPTLMAVYGWASPTVAVACERARELARELERPDRLYPPVWGLWTNHFVGGRLDQALVTAEEALAMALASGSPMVEVTGRHAVAYTHYYRGEWEKAIPHVEAALPLYSVEQERALASTFQLSSTVNLIAALGSSLWMMGRQDRGLEELERMLAVAREVDHPSALSNALGVACYMLTFHHDFPRMKAVADEVKGFAREEGYELWYAVGVMSSGWARLRSGGGDEALAELMEGVALFHRTGSDLMGPTVGVIHGEGLVAAGREGEALEMLAETARLARRGRVGVLLPDVHRLMGEIHLAAGRPDDAEEAFGTALETAREQVATSLELRAALAWWPLMERTGRREEGLARVREAWEGLPDGLDQPEPCRARALLHGEGRS